MNDTLSPLNWTFGLFFAIFGAAALTDMSLAGLPLFVIGCLLLPPIRKLTYSITKIRLLTKLRAIAIIASLMVFFNLLDREYAVEAERMLAQEEKELAEKRSIAKQEKIDFFRENKTSIIDSVTELISRSDFELAVQKASEYSVAKDEDLEQLYAIARLELEKFRKAKEIEDLIASLDKTPSTDYSKLNASYRRLAKLIPENEFYKEKYILYSNKIEEAELALAKAAAPRKSKREIKEEVKGRLILQDFKWHKAGGGSVMQASFRINNYSSHSIKDIKIVAVLYGSSGTKLDSSTRTIYEVIDGESGKTIKDFNMGFIHSQSSGVQAFIVDFSLN